MSDYVNIKVQPNGITLFLDDKTDFQNLVKDTEDIMLTNAKFYGNAKVTVTFVGRTLLPLEEQKLIYVIVKNSSLDVVCILDKDVNNNIINIRTLNNYQLPDLSKYARLLTKGLEESQILENEGNIVVLGNVPLGATLITTTNAIIIGNVEGEVYAGTDSDDYCFVIALDFMPERLEINKIKYKPEKKFKKNKKIKSQIAFIKDGKIVIEPFTNELPGIQNF